VTTVVLAALPLSGVLGAARTGVNVVGNVLKATAFVGLEIAFFQSAPIGPTTGAALFRWSKLVWFLVFTVLWFFAIHILFAPGSTYLDTPSAHGIRLLMTMAGLYSAMTIALWYAFEWRSPRSDDLPCPSCGQLNHPGATCCSECGQLLPVRKDAARGKWKVLSTIGLWLIMTVALGVRAATTG
jgi:hypothetical protein